MSTEPPTFDLQSHSLYSDGALEPSEVVAAAQQAGVELLAVSDHDTVDGVQLAADAADELGVRLVSAVEISSVDGAQQDLHVLGYLIDHHDSTLRERLSDWREDREHRADAMGEALRGLGYELDSSEIERRKAQGKPIGRPHLADAVVRHPANAERLRTEGLDERSAFLVAYLIDGAPAFRPRTKPTVAESIDPSTPPAEWPSGHIRSGTSTIPARCWRRSTASAAGALTASSASTPPTPASRRS